YLSARQVVWAIQRLDQELNDHQSPLPAAARATIQSLGQSADSRLSIVTKLPAGRQLLIVSDYLRDELDRRANYVPNSLQQQLLTLQSQLGSTE
ncbi:MAG TPA: hypothetical protein VIY86_15195, partial [Pirellulaceae bacterium]